MQDFWTVVAAVSCTTVLWSLKEIVKTHLRDRALAKAIDAGEVV